MAYRIYYDGTSAYKIDEYNEYNRAIQERNEEQNEIAKRSRLVSLKKIMVITLIVFAVSAAFLWTNALLLESSVKVTELTNELEDVKARNTQIAFDISSGTDLEMIEEKAVTEFGMQKPEGHQNVYIDVVQSDYTKMAHYKSESSGFVDDMIRNLKSFLAYIS